MKYTIPLVLAVLACAFSGCGTPAQAYAKQHPELPKQHLQILMSGKIPDGDAVAGMTRDQILLVMGPDVTQYTKVDGHDAWVYVRKKLISEPLTSTSSAGTGHQDSRNRSFSSDNATHTPDNQPQSKTTIIFNGDVAIKADTVLGGL